MSEKTNENNNKNNYDKNNCNETNCGITITISECAESHVGMEIIGAISEEGGGFNYEDLKKVKNFFEKKGCKCVLYHLNKLLKGIKYKNEDNKEIISDPAYVLVINNGINAILEKNKKDEVFNELIKLKWDTKLYNSRRNIVQNKKARYNLCFSNKDQNADFKNGKGTIISFKKVPLLNKIKSTFEKILPEKCKELKAEGNLYYNLKNTGIGSHGDSERRTVIAYRIGSQFPLHYQWFIRSIPIGNNLKIDLPEEAIYLMSEKSTGNDWKKLTIPTLRHSAGCNKYTINPIKSKLLVNGCLKQPKSSKKNYNIVKALFNIATEHDPSGIPVKFVDNI